jgi:hypothetical protein
MYMPETPSPSPMDGMALQQQQPIRRRGPVKRPASCLSGAELMAQTADFLAQQQLGFVQLWPANHQQQLSSMGGPWGTMDAAYAMSAQQVSTFPAPLMPHHQLQASSSGSILSAYGSEAAAGQMGGMPAGVPQRPTWQLRRISTRSEAVPHTGGPDCQCTQCLCARTDE